MYQNVPRCIESAVELNCILEGRSMGIMEIVTSFVNCIHIRSVFGGRTSTYILGWGEGIMMIWWTCTPCVRDSFLENRRGWKYSIYTWKRNHASKWLASTGSVRMAFQNSHQLSLLKEHKCENTERKLNMFRSFWLSWDQLLRKPQFPHLPGDGERAICMFIQEWHNPVGSSRGVL